MKKFVDDGMLLQMKITASIVYFATITTRSGRRTTRAYLLLQAQTMAVGTEFIFYMVELARRLVVFLQFRKSRRRRAKVLNERGDPLFIVLWQKPPKMAFKNSIYFVTDGSFTADGGLL